jgi:hypothetical protein
LRRSSHCSRHGRWQETCRREIGGVDSTRLTPEVVEPQQAN